MIIFCHILQQLTHVLLKDYILIFFQTVRTCMTVCYLTGFPVPEAVRAELKNQVAVIRKSPKSQVN